MSVDVSVYSLVGLKVRPEEMEYARDRYEELYDGVNYYIDFVVDVMSGEYSYVGIVLSNIDCYRGDDAVSIPLFDKTFSAEHVAGLIRLYFPELTFEATDIAFHSFTDFH